MRVLVVDVGVVAMPVREVAVAVRMGMGFARGLAARMRVLMVRVVDMGVVVVDVAMGVLMLVTLGEVEPHAHGHEEARHHELS